MMTLQERIEKWSIPEPNTGCWIWFGAARHGYGHMWINKKSHLAHRVSWSVYTGQEIPHPSIKICHSCDNKWCVNPDHLWPGSQRDNVLDCWAKGRAGPRGLIGEENSQASFTEEQIFAILDELSDGGRGMARVLAKRFGVAETTISAIKRGQNWSHVLQQWKEKRL